MKTSIIPKLGYSAGRKRTGLEFDLWSRGQFFKSRCVQVSEEEVGSDQFVTDVLNFFFEGGLKKEQLNDSLREVAATAVWKATEASKAMDMVPRPPEGKPSYVWVISQAVQIAFRRAQNQCIYEAVRKTIKLSMRSEYEIARDLGTSLSLYSVSFSNDLSLSEQGVNLIKQFEGFSSKLYNDPAGHCTIGYGTLVHRDNCNGNESDEFKKGISEERGTELLKLEANKFSGTVNNSVTVPLNQNQFDALVSFVYNIGPAAFGESTLLKKLNNGSYDSVPSELRKWVKGGGKVLPGLVKRREQEANLFIKSTALPGESTGKSLSDNTPASNIGEVFLKNARAYEGLPYGVAELTWTKEGFVPPADKTSIKRLVCNQLIWLAIKDSGLPMEYNPLRKPDWDFASYGFKEIRKNAALKTLIEEGAGAGLLPGDLLIEYGSHMAFFTANKKDTRNRDNMLIFDANAYPKNVGEHWVIGSWNQNALVSVYRHSGK